MSRQRALKWCLLAAITLVAAFLRLYRIDSLPPSDGYDQAAYGLDVLDILDGARPFFFPSNFGREALYSYLATLCYLIVGDVTIAVYATSAVVGVLTVPVTYLAAEELFATPCPKLSTRMRRRAPGRGPEHRLGGHSGFPEGTLARWGGLLAALTLVLSRWHLSWSRLGMRAILVPLFAALTVYLLWRGLRTGSLWAFLACGLSLGLSLHTYQAARALPLLVLLGYAYVAVAHRAFTWRDVLNLACIAVAALLVFAPLGIYFVNHPGSASTRIGQALVVDSTQGPGEALRALLDQGVKAALALLVRGDEDARVNVYGWPALNPFYSIAALLGVAVCLARLKRPAYPLLLTWLVGLSAPAILAQYGPVTKRAIGATPAVAMAVAVGCLAAWEVARRWTERRAAVSGIMLGLALLLGTGYLYSGIQAYRHYFDLWAQDPNLFTHFEAGQSAIGRYIAGRPPGERIYLSPVPVDHPSVALNSLRRPGVKGYHGQHCFVAVDGAPTEATYVIVPADDGDSLPMLAEILPQGRIVDEGPTHYGLPYYMGYRVPAGAQAQVRPAHRLQIHWSEGDARTRLSLLGYDLDRERYRPGETIDLTLYYRATGPVSADYTAFVHLLGPHNPATGGPLWAQDDSEPCRRSYRTSAWGRDEIIVDHYRMTIPADAPLGEYEIEMGFYEWQTLVRLSVVDAQGQTISDHAILTTVRVAKE